jgi:hypothetical protein
MLIKVFYHKNQPNIYVYRSSFDSNAAIASLTNSSNIVIDILIIVIFLIFSTLFSHELVFYDFSFPFN